MRRESSFWPILGGILGCAILIGLGTWQVQRMYWKQEVLQAMEARLGDAPVPLPAQPDEDAHAYMPVTASGTITDREVFVMAAERFAGVGYHVIAAFESEDGREILIDRGFIPADQRDSERLPVQATISGNLHWPDETDRFTPEPDRGRNLWFVRDLPSLAAELGTEETLIVLRATTEPAPPVRPVPLDTSSIPDNHLNYAITWYLLALVWVGMTGFYLWRIRRPKAE